MLIKVRRSCSGGVEPTGGGAATPITRNYRTTDGMSHLNFNRHPTMHVPLGMQMTLNSIRASI